MTLNVTAAAAGNVTFYIYGSSEEGWDYLYINQNGSQVWSSKGQDYNSWTPLSFSVSAGTTTFAFTYSKDSSNSYDIDKYCVDYLSAPALVPYSTTSSNPSTKTCNSDCTLGSGTCYNSWCGDGTKNGPEFCDAGGNSNNNNWSQNAHCNSTCTGWAPYCGDGHKDSSEACDGADVSGSCYVSRTCDGGCDDDYTCYDYYYYSCTGSCTKTKGSQYSTGNSGTGGYPACP